MKKTLKPLIKCRSCVSKKLSEVISLGNSYLSDFVTDNQKPPKYPLSLVLCKECSLLQLNHTTPANLLYTEHYGYRSGINQTMQSELKEIAVKNIEKLESKNAKILV